MSEADSELVAFLRAYVDGDRTARLALVDWLEERGDPRAEAVRAAKVDWKAVAQGVFFERNPQWARSARRRARGRRLTDWEQAEVSRIQWTIDCALVGTDAPADVVTAVRRAHRKWLAGLFPEAARSLPNN